MSDTKDVFRKRPSDAWCPIVEARINGQLIGFNSSSPDHPSAFKQTCPGIAPD